MNSAMVTRSAGQLLLLIFPTVWTAASSSAEPRGTLDRGVDWVATGIEVVGIAIIVEIQGCWPWQGRKRE